MTIEHALLAGDDRQNNAGIAQNQLRVGRFVIASQAGSCDALAFDDLLGRQARRMGFLLDLRFLVAREPLNNRSNHGTLVSVIRGSAGWAR